MQKGICIVPLSAVKSHPSHRSEITTQLLFGERCEVVDADAEWLKIVCKFDGYLGWCLSSHILNIEDELYNVNDQRYSKAFINTILLNESELKVPFGADMSLFRKKQFKIGSNKFISHSKTFSPSHKNPSGRLVKKLALQFINVPYLWGGKSVFGIDCSGFTQSVFKFMGITLPRDAWQQAGQGSTISSLTDTQCGDLCFFDNPEGRITHVGILLDKETIIHSSGKVRIDSITEDGIINNDTKLKTHRLKSIKRLF